jgi:hypothetical protein
VEGELSPYSPGLCGLAANSALPADLLDRFIAVADVDLCLDLADRDDLSPSQIQVLAALGGPHTVIHLVRRGLLTAAEVDAAEPRVALALLDEGGGPDAWARALQDHPDSSVRAGLAEAEHAPAGVRRALANDRDVHVVAEVAGSPRLPVDLLEELVRHPHLAVRRAVASNETTPAPLLAALITDGGLPPARFCYGCDGTAEPPPGSYCGGGHQEALVDLRCAVTTNPATPPAAAATSVDHPVAWVRWPLAERPDMPQEVYRRLANDPVPGVRGSLAQNPAIGESLMRAMASDDTNQVRRCLAHNPVVPLDLLIELASTTKIGPTLLPRIATASPDEVDNLLHSPVAAARMLLAERHDLPPDAVNLLAEDPDAKVLKSLAPNPTLTEMQLRAMLSRHGPRVIARVATNPTCGPDLLHDLATHNPPVQKAYRRIAAHPQANIATLSLCLHDREARPVAARHPALPTATILELLHDPDNRVAEAAATNPSLPRHAMESLLGLPNGS